MQKIQFQRQALSQIKLNRNLRVIEKCDTDHQPGINGRKEYMANIMIKLSMNHSRNPDRALKNNSNKCWQKWSLTKANRAVQHNTSTHCILSTIKIGNNLSRKQIESKENERMKSQKQRWSVYRMSKETTVP